MNVKKVESAAAVPWTALARLAVALNGSGAGLIGFSPCWS